MDVTLDFRLVLEAPQLPSMLGWRCLHAAEGGYQNPAGMPEVRPSTGASGIPFTRDMQLLSFNLNRDNPNLTPSRWTVVYETDTAFTNGQGFGIPDDPRVNYVEMTNIGAPYPKLMKAILCGGAFVQGEAIGSQLWCEPGYSAIDATKPIPSVEEVLERHWYFHAVLNGSVIRPFPQGGGLPVLIPYFLTEPVWYPLEWFERWQSDDYPDPYTIYR